MYNEFLISPSNGGLNRSYSGSSLPLCSHPHGDRRVQQALYMGCSSNSNVASFSPSGEIDRRVSTSNLGPTISLPYMPLPINTYQSTPRTMYSSSHYTSGNPGFYYDLMQNSVHRAIDKYTYHTYGLCTRLYSTPSYIFTHTSPHTPYILSNLSVYFGHPPPVDTHGTATSVDGLSCNTPQHSNQYIPCTFSHDVPYDSSLDPESQSLGGGHTEIGQSSFHSFPLEHFLKI